MRKLLLLFIICTLVLSLTSCTTMSTITETKAETKMTAIEVCRYVDEQLNSRGTLYYSEGLVRCIFSYHTLSAEYLDKGTTIKGNYIKPGIWLLEIKVEEEWQDFKAGQWISRGKMTPTDSQWRFDESTAAITIIR